MRWPSLLLCLLWLSAAIGQDTIGVDAYDRALEFLSQRTYNKKIFNTYVSAHWYPDSSGLWYTDWSREGERYVGIDLPEGKPHPLFDHDRLAELLSDELTREVDANALPISQLAYRRGQQVVFTAEDRRFVFNPATDKLIEEAAPAGNESGTESYSPDSSWIAYPRDYNLRLRSPDGKQDRALTADGIRNYEYASWYGWADILEGENAERPEHFGVQWSPDGQWLLANRVDLRSANKMFLLDWSVDTLYRPKLLSYYRGSPGDTGMVYLEPVFFNVGTGERVTTPLPRGTHINTVNVQWSDTPGKVYLQWQPRGFKSVQLLTLDLNSGRIDTLYTESSPTNIDNFTYELAEESDRLFFLSEKSGWRQLYSRDLAGGGETRLTRGEFYVDEIVRVDEEAETVYFLASGREADDNPYQQRLYRIGFDGGSLQLLTPEAANHRVDVSPDGKYFVDNYSTVTQSTRTVLRDLATGVVIQELARASTSELDDWSPPQPFTVKAGDGTTDIYGAIWKPTNFDSTRRYPVIDASYTGPHTYVYPTDYGAALSQQAFAELGFLVVRIDGRGSPGRSKAFHDFSYKNLGGNLGDHVAAIRQLGSGTPGSILPA